MMEDAARAIAVLRARGCPERVDCAIVLGTGLGGLADEVEDAIVVPYADIPGFPRSGVSGHPGRVVVGRLGRKTVLLLQGRAHYYETGDAGAMRVPVAVVAALGAPPLLLTNAAGSTHAQVGPGSLVCLSDHINLSGANPLIGDETDARFVSMTDAYDPGLRETLLSAAQHAEVTLHEGVYMWFSGPSFETPAEIRMARTLGADLVGMSTVPEVILARYHGLPVAGVSVVTNLAAGIEGASPSHQETKDVAAAAATGLRRLVRTFVEMIDDR